MCPDSWPPETSSDRRHAPTWTTGKKDGVGTSPDSRSRVWFTVAHGILTEVFFPRVDCANTRDLRLVLTADDRFFSDEAHDTETTVRMIEPGIPAYHIEKRCRRGRYALEKTIITDSERPVVLQRVRLKRLGNGAPLRAYVLLAPHVGNRGDRNDAWVDEHKGIQMLFARRGETALALAATSPFSTVDCSYAGDDDAWHDLRSNGHLTVTRDHAVDGSLLLGAELDLASTDEVVMALGFGSDHHAAAAHARAALLRTFDDALADFVGGWKQAQAAARSLKDANNGSVVETEAVYRASVAVLRSHEDKTYPGGLIASLAIPWGNAYGDMDEGGYHLVWPRDSVEAAGGLLAAGLKESARAVLHHLMSIQEAAGNWPQNMWLNGRAYWHGVQLDEAALPILLADLLRRHDALGSIDPWPMIRRAASYLVLNGPATPQDRWEREGGFSPFTLAAEVSALLIAAEYAEQQRELRLAQYLRETADYWNESIETWTYCTDDDLTAELGIEGYYARRKPAQSVDEHVRYARRERTHPRFARTNDGIFHSDADGEQGRSHTLVVDALALVRFGLRAPDDPRVVNTVRAIDACLKSDTRTGPVWHRFMGDSYGESAKGIAGSREGIGRGWPLLTGERAHFELLRGDEKRARELRGVMIRQSGACGMIPEQVWDAPDLPERGLFNGRPSGSAMPLAWAHAEFVKLCRSLDDREIFDMPAQPLQRYGGARQSSPFVVWRANAMIESMSRHKTLRIEVGEPATITYRVAGSERSGTCVLADTGLGVYVAELPTSQLPSGAEVRFRIAGAKANGDAREFTVRISE